MNKPPRTAKEEWKALVDFAADGMPESAVERTEAEVDAELAAAGFDVAAETAKGQAEHEEAVRRLAAMEAAATPSPVPTPKPTPIPKPTANGGARVVPLPRRPRWVYALVAAAALAGLILTEGSAIVAWVTGEGQEVRTTMTSDQWARDLRTAATKAAEAKNWSRAKDLLDRAKEVDPEGDRAPAVQETRALVEKNLASPDHPPP